MKSRLSKIQNKIKKIWNRKNPPNKHQTTDHIDLSLWGLNLSVTRETTSEVPSELTVVVPRAEFRHDCKPDEGVAQDACDTEVILNSITIVIAPRHPTEHGTASHGSSRQG